MGEILIGLLIWAFGMAVWAFVACFRDEPEMIFLAPAWPLVVLIVPAILAGLLGTYLHTRSKTP